MIYSIEHKTEYEYQDLVSACHNIVYQKPLNSSFQKLRKHEYLIEPKPQFVEERFDFFENSYAYFSLEVPHKNLIVVSKSEVELQSPFWQGINLGNTMNWEEVAIFLQSTAASNDVRQFCLESTLVYYISGMRDYVLAIFRPGRPILESMLEFNTRIYHDFKYKSGYTDISTPMEKLFHDRTGVCQDFAHFSIACLRSIGLAAKYVSGYIENIPPPGKKKLKGSDASHAWLSLFVPNLGWVEFDPTNNMMISQQHIRVAVGRDFKDVVPLKGIVYSSGGHELKVAVDVKKIG